jgi:hypothetical protein
MEQPPNYPPTRARGNNLQDIAAYRYLQKYAIGNEAERIERRTLVGRRLEVGETRRMNAYRIVGEPALENLSSSDRVHHRTNPWNHKRVQVESQPMHNHTPWCNKPSQSMPTRDHWVDIPTSLCTHGSSLYSKIFVQLCRPIYGF